MTYNELAAEWWESLTEAQRAIIHWCREDSVAQSQHLRFAQVRERTLDEFYRKEANTNVTPKKVEKYEFVYNRFEQFKNFIYEK